MGAQTSEAKKNAPAEADSKQRRDVPKKTKKKRKSRDDRSQIFFTKCQRTTQILIGFLLMVVFQIIGNWIPATVVSEFQLQSAHKQISEDPESMSAPAKQDGGAAPDGQNGEMVRDIGDAVAQSKIAEQETASDINMQDASGHQPLHLLAHSPNNATGSAEKGGGNELSNTVGAGASAVATIPPADTNIVVTQPAALEEHELLTPATKCRIEYDDNANLHHIPVWVRSMHPIFFNAVVDGDTATLIFTCDHVRFINKQQHLEFQRKPWFCLYGDTLPETVSPSDAAQSKDGTILTVGEFMPHRSTVSLLIKCPLRSLGSPAASSNSSTSGPVLLDLIGAAAAHVPPAHLRFNHTYNASDPKDLNIQPRDQVVYDVRPSLECDKLDRQEEPAKGPIKVAACAFYFGEETNRILPEWVTYHSMIGIDHIFLFVAEPFNATRLFRHPNLTYVPHNHRWSVHQSMHDPRMKLWINHFWQQPMMQTCLYRLKRMKAEWMLSTDMDEFVHVTYKENATMSSNANASITKNSSLSNKEASYRLHEFLDKVKTEKKVGAIKMKSIPYGKHPSRERAKGPQPMLLDYTWRKAGGGEAHGWHRTKLFFRLKNAFQIGVHWIYHSGQTRPADADTELYVHHYKNPTKGVSVRGDARTLSPRDLAQDTRLWDQYRNAIAKKLGIATATGL